MVTLSRRHPARLTHEQLEQLWALMSTFVERERAEFEQTLRSCERVWLARRGG